MKLLVVEDEALLRHHLYTRLGESGHVVEAVADAEEALYQAGQYHFDLAIIDLGLPGISGLELITRLRSQDKTFPILILTARGNWQDKVEGLAAGADDYLVKPFEVEELLARVGAVLRRAGRGGQTLTAFGVTLDVVARQVTQNGSPVDLTPREFALLEQLMRNRGAALYRDVLYERVWGAELTDTRTLDLHIQRLRKKPGWRRQIRTVFRVGYELQREEDLPAGEAQP